MADYTFKSEPVYDPSTDKVVEGATGGVFVAVKDGPALPIFDLNGTPIANISSNASGMSTQFTANEYEGFIQFGDLAVPVVAQEVATFAVNAQGAIDTANNAASSAAAAQTSAAEAFAALQAYIASNPGGGTGGVTDHGALSGLADDDHPQYLNTARGDVRYYTQAQTVSAIATANAAASTEDRKRGNHTGLQPVSTVEGLETRLATLEAGGGGGGGTLASLPAGVLLKVEGSATARPTARTDLPVLWVAASQPPGMLNGDIWLNEN